MPELIPSPAEQTFFSLLAVTTRIQEILQPAIGKQFWLTTFIGDLLANRKSFLIRQIFRFLHHVGKRTGLFIANLLKNSGG
jgi:ubiquinone biosynthesis protein UbiJ